MLRCNHGSFVCFSTFDIHRRYISCKSALRYITTNVPSVITNLRCVQSVYVFPVRYCHMLATTRRLHHIIYSPAIQISRQLQLPFPMCSHLHRPSSHRPFHAIHNRLIFIIFESVLFIINFALTFHTDPLAFTKFETALKKDLTNLQNPAGRISNGIGMATLEGSDILKNIEVAESPKLSSRRKRVRSLIRKRGTRGSGRTKQMQKGMGEAGAEAETKAKFSPSDGPNPSPNGHQHHLPKRARVRKNRSWKPYSQQTWEERLEREQAEERKAAEKNKQSGSVHNSSSKRAKRRKTNEFEMPKAPRNTTQNLLHTTDYYSEDFDVNQRQMPSLQGLLSRETIRLKFLGDENSRPTSDDEDDAGGDAKADDEHGPRMNSPAYSSVGSVGSPCADLSPEHHSVAASGGSLDREELVQRLLDENRRLRNRVEELEQKLAEKDRLAGT